MVVFIKKEKMIGHTIRLQPLITCERVPAAGFSFQPNLFLVETLQTVKNLVPEPVRNPSPVGVKGV